eukprot:m.213075 g.213075  ORF g.213075 m.213075 type:complete len:75 (+) comp22159_c1_seq7:19-243(+)
MRWVVCCEFRLYFFRRFSNFPLPLADNCQHSAAALFCAECNSRLCSSCDMLVGHKESSKASHHRTPINNKAGRQ